MFYKSTLLLALVLTLFTGIASIAQNENSYPKEANCCGFGDVLLEKSKSMQTDTIHCKLWDAVNEAWIPNTISIQSYDENGRSTNVVSKFYNTETGMFQPSTKIVRTWYPSDSIETQT